MLKRFLILLLILSVILLNACTKPDPVSDDTQPSTTSPAQETEPSATEPTHETEPSATNPSLPDIVDPYLRDFHIFSGTNEFLSFYADSEDSMTNLEYINSVIHPGILTHPSYQVRAATYTRVTADLIKFSGAEEFRVIYHYCIGGECDHHSDDDISRQSGEVKLFIWHNPDEYADHSQRINKLGQLVDETLQVYCDESSDMAMYTCYHTPEYLFQFRVDRDIEGFDTIVEDVMQYFAEIAPQ
jgi:hypothetical protein